jgi:hypothetical protein
VAERPAAGRLPSGARLFARYAYAPNSLGYCGPADSAVLFDLAATGRADAGIVAIAARFSGAWPYLTVLAEQAGVAEGPLAERVVRAYWIGGPLLETVDHAAFGARLLDRLGGEAGHYWAHLTADLLQEVTPTHGFHVFGVYPWSRLLAAGPPDEPLRVLDSCRIRWGQVVAAGSSQVVVRARRLAWDGRRLGLGPAEEEAVRLTERDRGFVTAPEPGEWLALHWNWACDRLTEDEVGQLERLTQWQLTATNARLGRMTSDVAAAPGPGQRQTGVRP